MPSTTRPPVRTLLIATLALVGFAANSLLARAALGTGRVDAAGYTVLRLASGAIALALLLRAWNWRSGWTPAAAVRARPAEPGDGTSGTWLAGAALALYAATFSYSYLRIGAALGALVLFTTVKIGLLGWGVVRGEPPQRQEAIGGGLALGGLLLLTAPGVSRPDLVGVALMIAAGASWAAYTVAGRGVRWPLAVTAGNFARSIVVVLPLIPVAVSAGHHDARGVLLAVLSGAIASGLSYVLWYAAVPSLTSTQAGLAQLSVPALAVVGAVLFLGEHLTLRVVIAAATIFAGVAAALLRR